MEPNLTENMNSRAAHTGVGKAAKAGAGLYLLWAILHLWVGAEGFRQFLRGVRGQWEMLIGGPHAPREAFQHATDAMTANVHGHLLANFVLDVGGYGVLGLYIAWALYRRGSWTAYFLGLVVIGIADLAFLFMQVTPGFIPLEAGIEGPVIWALACIVTPFGLRPLRQAAAAH